MCSHFSRESRDVGLGAAINATMNRLISPNKTVNFEAIYCGENKSQVMCAGWLGPPVKSILWGLHSREPASFVALILPIARTQPQLDARAPSTPNRLFSNRILQPFQVARSARTDRWRTNRHRNTRGDPCFGRREPRYRSDRKSTRLNSSHSS